MLTTFVPCVYVCVCMLNLTYDLFFVFADIKLLYSELPERCSGVHVHFCFVLLSLQRHLCVCLCVCVCMHAYVYARVCMRAHSPCVSFLIRAAFMATTFVCACVCVCACMRVCLCVYFLLVCACACSCVK
jgi:hypothetical protein